MNGTTWTLPAKLAPGGYLVTVNTSMTTNQGLPTNVRNIQCRSRLGTADPFAGTMAVYSGAFDSVLSFTGLARVGSGGVDLFVTCDATGTSYSFTRPLVVTVTGTNVVNDSALILAD